MFRRVEKDELSDPSEVDPSGQRSLLGGSESVKVLSAQESSFTPPAAQNTSSSANAGHPSHAHAPRPPSEAPSRSTGNAASTFRPAQPPAELARSRPQEPKPASAFGSSGSGPGSDRNRDSRRVLTVGADILLKGEIATCDRLVIEGKVDAVLNDVGTVELAESGSFKGVANIENAEISGLFDGELVVKGRLVIYASGRVRGKVTYGEIEIERGGELTGEIKTIASTGAASGRRTEKSGIMEKSGIKEDKVAVA